MSLGLLVTLMLIAIAEVKPAGNNQMENAEMKATALKVVFLNASKNRDGNTAILARQVLKGRTYKTVNLVDFHIDQLGQKSKR